MRNYVIAAMVALCFAMPQSIHSQDDLPSTITKLDEARSAYDRDVERAREALLGLIARAYKSAQISGDFKRVSTIRGERDAFIAKGTLPTSVNTAGHVAALARARKKLEVSLAKARTEFTRAGKLAEAEAINTELTRLKATAGQKGAAEAGAVRSLWVRSDNTQYFMKGLGTDWFEKAADGKRAEIFTERARTKDFVELRHATSPITIRLAANGIAVRFKDTEPFKEGKDAGTWVAK